MTFLHKLAQRLSRMHTALILGALATVACELPVATDQGSVVRLQVLPQNVALHPGQTAEFVAVGLTSGGDTVAVAVNWSVTGGDIVDTTISGGKHVGHYKSPTSPGHYKVKAVTPTLADSATIDVNPPPVAKVAVTPSSASAVVGQTVQLTAATLDSAGAVLSGRVVTWGSSNTAVATVNASGLVTGMAAGSATITATSEGQSGTSALTVTPVPVASVGVSPIAVGVTVGQTAQFTATPRDANGNALTGRVVTWGTSNSAVATVNSSGLATGMTAGSATVTATSEGRSGTASITVTATAVPVASVSVSPASANVTAGQTVQLTATPRDANGNALTGRVVTWASSNTALATVSGSGLVSGVAAGSATITATSEGQSGSSAITVTAVPVPVASVSVTPASASITTGQTVQLTATPKDANGNVLTGRVVTWVSSAAAVATVNGSGLVTAVGAGSATITATSEGKSGTATVTVTPVPVATVSVSPASASLTAGQTVQLTATPRDANGNALTGRVVTWVSSNTSIAPVSGSGLVTGGIAGSATITATSEGKSGTSTVTVTLASVASVTVLPASASAPVGTMVQLTAIAKDSAGNTLTGRTMTWSSSNSAIATVTSAGLVTALATGSTTVTATSGGKSGTANITVTAAVPPSGCVTSGSGVCYYVDAAAGNDANSGTSAQPFRTLQKAANVVSPGDGVLVNDGIYTGGSTILDITRSGTAANWIVFRAAHRWGAIIDGQNNSSTAGVSISANYIAVEGFEIRNTSRSGMDAYNGNEVTAASHDVRLARNHIHDIGHICTDDTGGRAGIDAYASNMVIEENVIHDIGRLSPGEQGCSPSTSNWTNHDHGIYHGTGDSVIVRNNLLYRNVHGWSYHRYSGPGASVRGLYIVNNTFAFPNPSSGKMGQIVIAGATSNLVIANNVFYQSQTAGIWFDAGDGGTWSGALIANNLSSNAVGNSVSGLNMVGNIENTDPMLVSPTSADFHLRSGSPAVDRGMMEPTVIRDVDGVLRPQRAGYDIGASELP